MKIFTNKNLMQKIIIAMIFVIFFNFAIPNTSNAAGFGGKLFTSVIQLIGGVGDIGVGLLHKSILGTQSGYGSVMLDKNDVTVKQMQQDGMDAQEKGRESIEIEADDMDQGVFTWDESHEDLQYPNMLYTPEAIFSNKIATLDVNFINPNKYTAVESSDSAKDAAVSIAVTLQPIISTWYNAFRNIALVGLLSVLVYIGIRIVLSSTSSEKAKYKERIMDWLVAICLLFVMHYIMSFTLVITEEVTKMFSSTIDDGIIVHVENEFPFKTNFMGYIRFMVQSDSVQDVAMYTILYLVLVIYTFMFTITYLKRVLYMAFFTMIAPLVALTYPIDKISDGKPQAFNMWLREYIFNAIIQPVHLMLYIVLIGTSIDLCANNPIYALVVLGFLLPAEKFIKKMFGFNKAEMTSGLGAVAGGALAMSAIKSLAKPHKSNGGKSNGGASGSSEDTGSSRGKSDRFKNFDPYEAIAGGKGDNLKDQDEGLDKSNVKDRVAQRLEQEGFSEDYSVQKAKELGIEGDNKKEQWKQAREDRQKEIEEELLKEQQSNKQSNSGNSHINLGSMPRQEKTPTLRQKAGKIARGTIRGVAAVGGKQLRQAGQRFTPKKIAKFAGRNVARAGLAAIGGSALGVAGLAAGIATGDFEKAIQYGVAGAGAGAGLGISARDKMANAISNNSGTFTQAYYGEDYKKHKQKEFDKNFKTNEKNIQKLQEYCNSKGKNWKEVMQSQQMQSYLDADITDIKDIITGMKLEDSTGITTDRAIASYKLANQTSDSILTDKNKLSNFKQTLLDSGISKKEAEKTIEQVKYWKDK